jgi:integrase
VDGREPRTRRLTHDEFPKRLAALDTTEWMAKRISGVQPDEAGRKPRARREHVADRQLFVMVACLTGAELSARSQLDWTDVDFTTGWIRIPGTKNATRDRSRPPECPGPRCPKKPALLPNCPIRRRRLPVSPM